MDPSQKTRPDSLETLRETRVQALITHFVGFNVTDLLQPARTS